MACTWVAEASASQAAEATGPAPAGLGVEMVEEGPAAAAAVEAGRTLSGHASPHAAESPVVIPAHELVGEGPDLVLIPGTFADRRTWSRAVGRLSARFRCLLLDPRGTHQSEDPGAPFTADDLVDDVVAAMDAAGLNRAHLVGHSLGASVAVTLAARQPDRVRRLVACAPSASPDAFQHAMFDLWAALAASRLPPHALHLGLVINAFGRGAFEDGTVKAIVDEMDRYPIERATIARYVDCNRRLDLNPVMRSVDAATLVIVGSDDSLTGAARRSPSWTVCLARGWR